eukprot:COSAG01_NODE_1528_length_10015_cov_7.856797_9_plen_72_part_00
MLEEMRDLEKHLKLDDTIIQHFVPVGAAVCVLMPRSLLTGMVALCDAPTRSWHAERGGERPPCPAQRHFDR